jgi:large subunit ribosomal protein L22
MTGTAQHKFARISATKARPVANLIRGLTVDQALGVLALTNKRAATMIDKVLRSAWANVHQVDSRADSEDYRVSELRIDGGPMFKRIRPRAMGRAVRIRKRTSHISLVLSNEA